MADLGRAALVVSFGLALYALVAGTVAAISRQRRLADSARYALIACFGSTVIASGVLVRALLTHDFTFRYVEQHTSRDLKPIYSLTAFWGGEEGSLLLWLLVLTGYGALAVMLNRRLLRDLVVWVVPVLAGIATFFSFMLVAVASPFVTEARVVDGAGLVPSLQNIYMVIHPPMLYLGYVGMSVPFAFATGAMLSGQTDERWIVATRRWTLTAWTFLGFGLLLGSHWAYIEVGWGGYYGWDPVENAALMPWIAGDRVPALGDDPGAQGNAARLEHGADRAHLRADRVRDVPQPLRRDRVDPLVREELDRRLVPRLRDLHDALLADADPLAAAAAARPHEARVGALARGDLPLQQPAARRALPDRPLGRDLPDPHPAVRGGDEDDGAAVLRLLPAGSSGSRSCS